MSFLNVGGWELTVILVLAILLVGPKRVVQIVRSIRRYASQLGEMTREFTSTLESEADEGGDGAAGQGLADLVKPITDVQNELRSTADQTRQAMEGVVKDLGAVEDVKDELSQAAEEARAATQPSQDTSASEIEGGAPPQEATD